MGKYFETLNINGLGPQTQEDFIELNKVCSKVLSNKSSSKKNRCFICKKQNKPYCNSHTIPQFILKNIAKNGKLLTTQIFNKTPFSKPISGLNNTQTFHKICTDCDKKTFKDYENPDAYDKIPSQNILKQIALKSYISRSYKHQKELKLGYYAKNNIQQNADYLLIAQLEYELNVCNYNYQLNNKKANFVLKNLNNDEILFKIQYFKTLDYVVPYALQSHFIILFDFNDKPLANTFDISDINAKDDIILCIFPLKTKSIIIAFDYLGNSLYDNFFTTLNTLTLDEQLSIINYLVFLYCEDIYFNNNIDDKIKKDENLIKFANSQQKVGARSFDVLSLSEKEYEEERLKEILNSHSINNYKTIPNLLDKKYAINPIRL